MTRPRDLGIVALMVVVVISGTSAAQAQWSWLDKNIPAYGQEPIRTGMNVRLGIVSWMYDFGSGDLSPAARANYVAPRFDMFFHDTIYWDPASIATIRAHNPAVAAFLGAWPTLADERSNMYFGAVGGYNPATMSSQVLRTSGGVEVPSQLWDFGDTHYMDIGNAAWAAYFKTKITAEVAKFGSDGIVMDGTPMDGVYYLGIPGYSPLANYSNSTQVNNALFSFFDSLRTPHTFLTMDDRTPTLYSSHYDGIWGEDWMGYNSTVPFGFNDPNKWNQAVSDLSSISAQERPYIAQGWYHAGNRNELAYLVGSYLLGKQSNSATFQPMPIGHPDLPPNPSYDFSSYWVAVYEAELKNYAEIFDVKLGDSLANRVQLAPDLWGRHFSNGLVYVNASLNTTRLVTLPQAMYDIDGNLVTQVTLLPRSSAILAEFAPWDVNLDGFVNIFDINIVSATWNQPNADGDANRDGIVNIFDINLISAKWSHSPANGFASVPEPSTWTLALFAVGAGLAIWRPTCMRSFPPT